MLSLNGLKYWNHIALATIRPTITISAPSMASALVIRRPRKVTRYPNDNSNHYGKL